MIYLGTKNKLRNIPVNKIREFEVAYVTYLEQKHKDVLVTLKSGKIDDYVMGVLEAAGEEISKNYTA
jgi:F-type H+-transporting ATPase subunit alpha